MRASPSMIAAMVADIDFQRVGNGGEVDLVGAEEKGELRLGRDDIPDAARLCIAEHQAAHAARRHMADIEAVPTPFPGVHALGSRDSRALSARPRQRPAAGATQIGTTTSTERMWY